MQKMSLEERKVYIEKNSQERAQLQAKINQLNAEREKFVAQRMKEMKAASGASTLDAVVISAVREQGEKRNFTFK